MTTRASIRVAPPAGAERPSNERLHDAADRLREHGFDILRVGRFAVSVEAEPSLFREVLGVTPKPGEALTLAVEPRFSDLSDLVDFVEVSTAPTPFRHADKG